MISFDDFSDTSTVSKYNNPDHHLWYMVVRQIINDFKSYNLQLLRGLTPKQSGRSQNINEYINTGDFEYICELLDVEPSYLRANLHRWLEQTEANHVNHCR